MDEEKMEQTQEQAPKYVPRPAWQVWLARIALVVFVLVLAVYYYNWFTGGGA